MKIEPNKDRKAIGNIIKKNIDLLKINDKWAYQLADCIMLYYVEKKTKQKIKRVHKVISEIRKNPKLMKKVKEISK